MQESMEKEEEREPARVKRINRIKGSVRHRPIHRLERSWLFNTKAYNFTRHDTLFFQERSTKNKDESSFSGPGTKIKTRRLDSFPLSVKPR